MKQFAIFLPNQEQALIVEGDSAEVKRKPDGLLIKIKNGKVKTIFKGAIIFTEISKVIKVL